MTGLLHEKEFSRKTLRQGRRRADRRLLARRLGARRARRWRATRRSVAAGYQPGRRLRSTRGSRSTPITRSTLKTSQIEVGNGITTGFLQVLAEELNMDMSQMHYGDVQQGEPRRRRHLGRGELGRRGRLERDVGHRARRSAPRARSPTRRCSGMASAKLGVPVASLTVKGGVVSGGGQSVSYGELVGGKLFNLDRRDTCAPAAGRGAGEADVGLHDGDDPEPGAADRHPGEGHRRATPTCRTSVCRGCCTAGSCGRAARAPIRTTRTCRSASTRPRSRTSRTRRSCRWELPRRRRAAGVRRDPGGGAAEGRLEHEPDPAGHRQPLEPLPASSTRPGTIAGGDRAEHRQRRRRRSPRRRTRVSGTFKYHYQGHMPIGPSCALADVTPTSATVWSNTQNVYGPRHRPRRTCSPRCRRNQIRVLFYEGAGSFGNGCVAFDTAESAAIMSKAVGAPVRLQFMRWDEHGWTHYGPAIMTDMRAASTRTATWSPTRRPQFTPGRHLALHRPRARRAGQRLPTATANALPTSVAGSGTVTENTSPWMKVVDRTRTTS